MQEIQAQFNGKAFIPYTFKDKDEASEFKPNQICTLKITGTGRARSLPQLRMFWACCRKVAANTENRSWNTEDKVAGQIKVELNFIDMNKSFVDPKGNFHPHWRSISIKNLKHMEACKFFDRAWPVMADHLGCSVDELLSNAEDGDV